MSAILYSKQFNFTFMKVIVTDTPRTFRDHCLNNDCLFTRELFALLANACERKKRKKRNKKKEIFPENGENFNFF